MGRHLAIPLALAFVLLALAGCSYHSTVTVGQSGMSATSSKESKALDCSGGTGDLTYAVAATAGKVHLSLADSAGTKLVHKSDVSVAPSGAMGNLKGVARTSTVTVKRTGLSSHFTVNFTC